MIFGEFTAAAPEITLLILISVVLIADLFVSDERRAVTFWLTIGSLAITAWSIIATAPAARTVIFDGSYVSDALSQVLKLGATGVVAVGFLYSRDYLRQNGLLKGEYYILGLFGLLGMLIMISANSLLTMYLGLETLSLSLYALVAFDRGSQIRDKPVAQTLQRSTPTQLARLHAAPLVCGAGGMSLTLQFPSNKWVSSGGKVTRVARNLQCL